MQTWNSVTQFLDRLVGRSTLAAVLWAAAAFAAYMLGPDVQPRMHPDGRYAAVWTIRLAHAAAAVATVAAAWALVGPPLRAAHRWLRGD